MAKCKNCKKLNHILNSGVSVGRWCVEKSDSPDIERERICDKYVPMTNADRIRNMTDEELAEWLNGFSECLIPNGDCLDKYCDNCVMKWLKSEVGCE